MAAYSILVNAVLAIAGAIVRPEAVARVAFVVLPARMALVVILPSALLLAGCVVSPAQPSGMYGCGAGDHVCVATQAALYGAQAQDAIQRAGYATQGAAAAQAAWMTALAATPTAAAMQTQGAISLAATGTVAAAESALAAAQLEATATRLGMMRAQESLDATATPLAMTQAAAQAERYRFQSDLSALLGAAAQAGVVGIAVSFAAFAAVAAGKGIWRLTRRGRVIRDGNGRVSGVEYADGVYHQPAKQVHATVSVYAGARPEPVPHAAQVQVTERAQAIELARALAADGASPAVRREPALPYLPPQPALPEIVVRAVPPARVAGWLADVEGQLLLPAGGDDGNTD